MIQCKPAPVAGVHCLSHGISNRKIDATDWSNVQGRDEWTAAVEAGKVLYFPQLTFELTEQEKTLLRPDVRDPKTRNISLNVDGSIKGGG